MYNSRWGLPVRTAYFWYQATLLQPAFWHIRQLSSHTRVEWELYPKNFGFPLPSWDHPHNAHLDWVDLTQLQEPSHLHMLP